MKYVVTHEGEEHELEVHEEEDGTFSVDIGGERVRADFAATGGGNNIYTLILENRSYELLIIEEDGTSSVIHHGRGIDLEVESERERNARLISGVASGASSGSIVAVMPGIVLSVAVAVGDKVTKGDAVVVLEAMKMENEIRAESDGVVAAVLVKPGQTVNSGDVLVEIEAE